MIKLFEFKTTDLNILNGILALDLHVEAALMCLDSLKLPNCVRTPYVGSSVSVLKATKEKRGVFGSSLSGRTCVSVLLSCTRAICKCREARIPYSAAVDLEAGLGVSYVCDSLVAVYDLEEPRIVWISNYVMYGTSMLVASTPMGVSKMTEFPRSKASTNFGTSCVITQFKDHVTRILLVIGIIVLFE
ncbi:hypothetical protein M9H77_22165 [Catharanthus roseus]|uniref:Uncharacterized protein n=1 Tax=Catharanthus roseus TaxID=4058 RepID=A0ACC0AQW4_CATRO|nr:hypothetical protein M9H77_22165 [Catharanthus roseus]